MAQQQQQPSMESRRSNSSSHGSLSSSLFEKLNCFWTLTATTQRVMSQKLTTYAKDSSSLLASSSALMWIFRVNFISVCHYTSFPTLQTNTQYKTTIWLLPSNIPEEVHNIAATEQEEAKNKEFSPLLFLSQTLK